MNKIKQYLKGVWLADILIIIILTILIINSIIITIPSGIASIDVNALTIVNDKQKFINNFFEYRTLSISNAIYNITDNFNSEPLNEEELLALEGNKYGAYFIIRDTRNNKLYTNNPSIISQLGINSLKMTDKQVIEKLKSRGYIVNYVDNSNKNNLLTYVSDETQTISKKQYLNTENYTEIYFDSYRYIEQQGQKYIKKAYLVLLEIIFLILFILKLILNLIFNPKNIHLNSTVIDDYIFVFKNCLRFRYPRRVIIITGIVTVSGIILYLYSLIDGSKITLFENILTKYPFKSILVISVVPMLVIAYMIKDNIDLCILNQELDKISKGDIDIEINYEKRQDIRELVDHVNKIKSGYKIMLDDKVKNEKLKTELISNVSHDLKTPLTSIINYIELLKRNDLLESEKNEYIDIIDKKSHTLKILIDDLFEMSKLNNGKINLDKTNVDIVSLIYQVIGENCYSFEDKNITFKVNSEFEECVLLLDGNRFSRVIENIVINALKYSINNTRVYVDILDKKDKILISFKNIANYDMNFDNNELFERFVRGDKSRTSTIEGSGIGLSIAKSIIELHNGEVNISVEGDMFKLYILLNKNNNI